MGNAATLGAYVNAFGVVGNDEEGRVVRKSLKTKGIDDSYIVIEDKRPTTVKTRLIVGHHQLVRYDMESLEEVSYKSNDLIIEGLEKIASSLDMILLSDYDKGTMNLPLVSSILKLAVRNKLPVLVDPKLKYCKNYRGVNYVKINLHNAEKVSGMLASSEDNVRKIALLLSDILQCKNIIITRGKDGLSASTNGTFIHMPALAKEVFDVTGAGDVMMAALGIAISNGYSLKDACGIATIAAAIKVGKVGTYSVSLKELVERVKVHNGSQ
jgi:D-beta-D-heptose 7-phosphate kinase/D-beta-D-heptose 1-phosphate adenosyltransferase